MNLTVKTYRTDYHETEPVKHQTEIVLSIRHDLDHEKVIAVMQIAVREAMRTLERMEQNK